VNRRLMQDALFQCDCGTGQYMFGQVWVIDCAGYGDRADEDTEREDRRRPRGQGRDRSLTIPGATAWLADCAGGEPTFRRTCYSS
jgi:hypothetical protein